MISIAVCDDDSAYIQKVFKAKLTTAQIAVGGSLHVSFYKNGNDLIEDFKNNKRYDIVMLDIDMPEINGKETAEKLRLIDSGFFLIFITSYKTEVMNTIPYRINAFIPKDSNDEYYISELTRVLREYEKYKPNFEIFQALVNGQKQTVKFLINDIFYFYCINKVVFLVTVNSEIALCVKISDIAAEYLNKDFFEICRGYIVNISKVKVVKKGEVVLDNGARLPLSRGRDKPLLQKLTEYISLRT